LCIAVDGQRGCSRDTSATTLTARLAEAPAKDIISAYGHESVAGAEYVGHAPEVKIGTIATIIGITPACREKVTVPVIEGHESIPIAENVIAEKLLACALSTI